MDKKISHKQLKDFGILVGICLPVFFGFLFPLIFGHSFRIWTLWVGLTLLITGLFKPMLLFYPYKAWMKLGFLLGFVNSRIILSIIFFIMLLPISIVMKLLGHDFLKIRRRNISSYREKRQTDKIDFKRIF